MAEMYLTDKLLAQQESLVSPSSSGPGFGSPSADIHPFNLEDATLHSDAGQVSDGEEDRYVCSFICLSFLLCATPYDTLPKKHELIASLGLLGRDGGPESLGGGRTRSSRSTSSTSTVSAKPLDVEELEMLLEAYFVQVDGTLNKLSTVRL